MEQLPNPKCTRCKCYWIPDETDIKSSGLYCKTCKKCRENGNKYNKQYRQENQDKIKDKKKQYYQENQDKIKEYKKQYRQENQDKIKEKKKQYRQENQDKIKDKKKQYYQENQDKIKEYKKQYRQENKDKIKQYHQENQDKIKKYYKQYYQDIKINNIPLYLCKLQRGQIRRCFNNSKLDKSKHSIEYLGCNIETFLNNINKKIEYFNNFLATDEIMTLDNIHIDHIKPISKFNLDDEDEFLSCCNYTNLQPLLIKDNLEKNNKWTDIDNEYWLKNIKDNDDYKEIYLIK